MKPISLKKEALEPLRIKFMDSIISELASRHFGMTLLKLLPKVEPSSVIGLGIFRGTMLL